MERKSGRHKQGRMRGKMEEGKRYGGRAEKSGKSVVRRGDAGKGREKEERERRAGDMTRKRKNDGLCHAFGECGGCQLLGIPYEEQLTKKKRELAKLLKPYVKLEGMIGMEKPEHYRNKVNAAFTHDRNGKPLSGVYKEGTHYIIPIEKCILENEKADEIIGSIRGLLPSFKIKTYDENMDYGLLRHVMVRVGHATGEIMVVLVLASPIMPSKNNFVKALLKLHPEITTIVLNINDRKTSMVLGDKEQVIYGKGYIEDVLCGIRFKISPRSFYQVNSVQTEKLYGKAIEYAGLNGKETVLDAYCGIGTIGMIAASKAKRVIGVELNRDAVRDAVMNAKKNQIKNVEFYQKDAGEFMVQLAEQGERIDTVFMDPPRTGSDEKFLEALVVLKPGKVVYISCNPETLVRDLEVLVKKGYRVDRGTGCDMFPFCGHVEAVCLMSRVKGK
jgi:23S rRNA (uracil-5-)-methyltransferase RumA